jgi:hypothetical protein
MGVVAAVDPRPVLHQVLLLPGLATESPFRAHAKAEDARLDLPKLLPDGGVTVRGGVGDHDDGLGSGPW